MSLELDVSEAIIDLATKKDIQLFRGTGGVWADGRFVDGITADATFIGSVQPNTNENQSLPEGVRTRGLWDVWSTSELKPSKREDGTPADIVMWDGIPHEVYDFKDWSKDGGYWYALVVKVQQ